MGQLNGIKWRVVVKTTTVLLLSGSLVLGASGCTYVQLDGMRPEVNNGQAMVVFPDQYSGVEDLEQDDGTSNPTGDGQGIDQGGAAGTGGATGTVVANPSKFATLPYNVVAAGSYSTYLDTQIYQPVSDIIAGLDGDASNHLYFRVFHSGYEPIVDDATLISRASVYDNKCIGSLSSLAGTVLPTFTYKWLGVTTDLNKSVVSKARSNWLASINNTSVTPQSTWLNAAATPGVPSSLVVMWGNERLQADTLADYLQLVRTEVIGVIPNITFRVQLNASSKTTITINNTVGVVGNRYVDHMAKIDVDRLFGYYNQYSDRRAVNINFYEEDDYSAVFSYIDGYSKTLVVLACQEGYNLDDLLGSQKSSVISKIKSTLKYTDWTAIQAYVPDAVIIQSGVRGMD